MVGLIPAWAGKTSSTPGPTPTPGAHPRVGGENSPTMGRSRLGAGSSPRGRGKPGTSCAACQPIRLIPAWAGKTDAKVWNDLVKAAHPRVGGENEITLSNSSHILGSSPRGRGKPQGQACVVGTSLSGCQCLRKVGRLIPAWAGKTTNQSVTPVQSAAHPRVGGENAICVHVVASVRGSSPRGRGKPEFVEDDGAHVGLIPAWAGKTP